MRNPEDFHHQSEPHTSSSQSKTAGMQGKATDRGHGYLTGHNFLPPSTLKIRAKGDPPGGTSVYILKTAPTMNMPIAMAKAMVGMPNPMP
jgi:hypothetical protein